MVIEFESIDFPPDMPTGKGDYLESHPFPGLELYRVQFRRKGEKYDGNPDRVKVEPYNLVDANCVSSEIVGRPEYHKVLLDIDLPVKLYPSSTPGKFHLYIDKTLHWDDFELLLRTLAVVGIIEPGYASASVERRAAFLRLPWIKKEEEGDHQKAT